VLRFTVKEGTAPVHSGATLYSITMGQEYYTLELHFDFKSTKRAEYAQRAIAADPEPRPQIIVRNMKSTCDGVLVVEFKSSSLKLIRTATSAMFDYVQLAVSVFRCFDNSQYTSD
jgi:tRNA threonylcarbamoyladenosine modification (KEOPS) complex  Pcc1 subunit